MKCGCKLPCFHLHCRVCLADYSNGGRAEPGDGSAEYCVAGALHVISNNRAAGCRIRESSACADTVGVVTGLSKQVGGVYAEEEFISKIGMSG